MINSFPDSEGQDAEAESKQNGALEFVVKPGYSHHVHTKIIEIRKCWKNAVI